MKFVLKCVVNIILASLAESSMIKKNPPAYTQMIERNTRASPLAKEIMLSIPRAAYTKEDCPIGEDHPCQTIKGQTISAPHMHMMAIDALKSFKGRDNVRALDIGCGSGFMLAALDELVGERSEIIGIENDRDIASLSYKNLVGERKDKVSSGRIQVKNVDAYKMDESLGDFDIIHVGAKVRQGFRDELKKYLRPGGLLVVPVEEESIESVGENGGEKWKRHTKLYVYEKTENGFLEREQLGEVRFVSLRADSKNSSDE